MHAFHFFRHHGGQMPAPFVGFEQHLIGDDVEFFLHFALHIVAARTAQNPGQRAF